MGMVFGVKILGSIDDHLIEAVCNVNLKSVADILFQIVE